MARSLILSGSAQGLATQVNVDMLGGISVVNGTGGFAGLANKATPTVAESNQYLSSSLLTGGGATGTTIIKALNVLRKMTGEAAPAGSSGSIQIMKSATAFGSNSGLNISGDEIELSDGVFINQSATSAPNTFASDISASAGLLVAKDLAVSKQLKVTGVSTLTGNVTASAGLLVSKDLVAAKKLNVTGVSTFTGNITGSASALISKDLVVTKKASFGGNVTGSASLLISKDIVATK